MLTMNAPIRKPRKGREARDPERTRTNLLRAASSEVYHTGFQGAGLDRILAKAAVTKGALYHYFDSKEALGYAIVDEVIMTITEQKWLAPLREGTNPIDTLIGIVRRTSLLPEHVQGGCPLNNLSQEMSPLDEGFRQRAANVFRVWRNAIRTALQEGQKHGQVRRELDAEDEATFLVAAYEGYVSLAKNAQDAAVLRSGLRRITNHLETLRPKR